MSTWTTLGEENFTLNTLAIITGFDITGRDNYNYFEPATEIITSAGGTIMSQHCQIIIPPNAVDEETVITRTTLNDTSNDTMNTNVRL